MASSGTKATGFCVDLGPYACSNCQKMQGSLCMEPEVLADPEVEQERKQQGGVDVSDAPDDICCNEFLSKKDQQQGGSKAGMRSQPVGQSGQPAQSTGFGRRMLSTLKGQQQ